MAKVSAAAHAGWQKYRQANYQCLLPLRCATSPQSAGSCVSILCYLPAPRQEHGALNEHWTGQQDVPAGTQLTLTEITTKIRTKER